MCSATLNFHATPTPYNLHIQTCNFLPSTSKWMRNAHYWCLHKTLFTQGLVETQDSS